MSNEHLHASGLRRVGSRSSRILITDSGHGLATSVSHVRVSGNRKDGQQADNNVVITAGLSKEH